MKVIGFSPQSNVRPFIPDIAVHEGDGMDGRTNCLHKLGTRHVHDGDFTPVEPFELPDDQWFAVEESGIVQFRLTDEPAWRMKRSQELLKQATSIKGDPLRVLELVGLASSLHGVNLPELNSHVQATRAPDESLEETLKRIRRGAGG